jgi:hypothetical protein
MAWKLGSELSLLLSYKKDDEFSVWILAKKKKRSLVSGLINRKAESP